MTTEHHAPGMLARNSVLNLLGQVLPLLVGFLSIPYVVRGLGADGFGILSIAWMLLGTFSMLDLGLGRATTKFVAESLHPEKIHRLPGLVWTSIAMQTALGLAGGLLIAAFVPVLVDRLFKMPPSWTGEAKASLFILAASMPVLLLTNGIRGVLEAAQRFDLVNYIKVPTSFSFYLIAAVGIPLHWKVSTIILVSVVARLASAGAFLFFCLRVFPQLRHGWHFSRHELPALFSFGEWVMVSNVIGPIIGYIERFFIATTLSVGVLTYYAVPFELIARVVIFPSSIAAALFPLISHRANLDGGVSDVTSRTLKYLLFIMTPITAVFVFFAHDILRLWMGAAFAEKSTSVLQILAVCFLFNALAYIPFTAVQALGRPDWKAILDLGSLPLYIGCCWILVRHQGIYGAAISKAIATVTDCVVLFWFASRLDAFHWRDWLKGTLGRTLAASSALFTAVLCVRLLHFSSFISLVLAGTLILVYIVAFWTFVIGGEDRQSIFNLPRQLLGAGRFTPINPET